MSFLSATSAEAKNVAANSFPEFPGEYPTRVQLDAWIKVWIEDMNVAGFGAFARGELPYEVAKLIPRDLLAVPTDAALAAVVAEKNAKLMHDNKLLKIERDSRFVEMRNRLASRLAKSMGTTAALRLLALQTKHAYKKADGTVIVHSFNGEAMFVELVKLLDEVETDRDVKKHLRNVEKLRDTPMHDNCTGQEWSERMVDFNKSNMHIDVPYADLRFSKLIVGMMPKILATRAAVMVDKLKDESKFGDSNEVLKRVSKVIEESYDEEFTPAVTLAMVQALALTAEKNAKTYAVNRQSSASKSGDDTKAPSARVNRRGKKPLWTEVRPDGGMCHSGTCKYNHKETVVCWRDPREAIEVHKNVWDNEECMASIRADREKQAKVLNVKAKPLTMMTERKGKQQARSPAAANFAGMDFEALMEVQTNGATLDSVSMCAGEEDMTSPGMQGDDEPWQGASGGANEGDSDDEPAVPAMQVHVAMSSRRSRSPLSTPPAPVRMASLPPSSVAHPSLWPDTAGLQGSVASTPSRDSGAGVGTVASREAIGALPLVRDARGDAPTVHEGVQVNEALQVVPELVDGATVASEVGEVEANAVDSMNTSSPLMDKGACVAPVTSIWPRVLSFFLMMLVVVGAIALVAAYSGAFPSLVGCMSFAMHGFSGPSTALVLHVSQPMEQSCASLGRRAAQVVVLLATLAWLNCEMEWAYGCEWAVACVLSRAYSLCSAALHPLRSIGFSYASCARLGRFSGEFHYPVLRAWHCDLRCRSS